VFHYVALDVVMMVLGVEVGVEVSPGDYYKEPLPVTNAIPTMQDEMVISVLNARLESIQINLIQNIVIRVLLEKHKMERSGIELRGV
jgi:hypothetical protein